MIANNDLTHQQIIFFFALHMAVTVGQKSI